MSVSNLAIQLRWPESSLDTAAGEIRHRWAGAKIGRIFIELTPQSPVEFLVGTASVKTRAVCHCAIRRGVRHLPSALA